MCAYTQFHWCSSLPLQSAVVAARATQRTHSIQRQKIYMGFHSPLQEGAKKSRPMATATTGARYNASDDRLYTMDPAAMACSDVMAGALAGSQSTKICLGGTSTQPHGRPSAASRQSMPAAYISEASGDAPMAVVNRFWVWAATPPRMVESSLNSQAAAAAGTNATAAAAFYHPPPL